VGWFHSAFENLSAGFRRRRMRRFLDALQITAQTRVLDVGGTFDFWRDSDPQPRLVLLNMPRTGGDLAGAASWVAADGCALPFRDQSFDVVFSNSVIEHVGSSAGQRAFAAEAARVGRNYWVQTPNRWFPVEQHMLTPFLHWLPQGVQAAIVRRATVWTLISKPEPDRRRFYTEHYLSEIQLLGAAELRGLFPDARILRERFFGLTKSLIAVRRLGA